MFIVNERTPSTHSVGRVSDGSRKIYPIINSLTNVSKQDLSPVLQQKNYKHPVNNLLNSQVAPTTAYDMAVVTQKSSREQAYIHVSDRRDSESATKKPYPL